MTSRMPRGWFIAMWREGVDLTEPQIFSDMVAFDGGNAASTEMYPLDLTDRVMGCLTAPPEGLGLPEVRSGDAARAQRDGVIRTADWYGTRTVTFQVEVVNEGCPGCPDARTKVRQIEKIWSRDSLGLQVTAQSGHWMLIYPDNYDPANVGTDAQQYSGPYLLFGRPRGCEVEWQRSNEGRAVVSLRFDAYDHRLILPGVSTGAFGDFTVNASQCLTAFGLGAGGPSRLNHMRDPLLRTSTDAFGTGAATVTRPSTDGPHNLGYHQFQLTSASATSPFTLADGSTGTAGLPVVGGAFYKVSGYYWMNQLLGTRHINLNWYDSTGASISTGNTADLENPPATGAWKRGWGAVQAPENAAFARFVFVWSGGAVYPVGFIGRTTGLMMEEDFTATTLAEVSPPRWFFMGDYYGEWQNPSIPNNSASRTSGIRRNLAVAPRGDFATAWVPSWSGGTLSETPVVGAVDGPTDAEANLLTGTPSITTYIRHTVTAASASDLFLVNASTETRHGAYHPEASGTPRASGQVAVRVSRAGLTGRVVGAGITDAEAIDFSTGSSAQALTPGEWLVRRYTARADGNWVGFAPAVWIEGGTLQIGDTIDVTATYMEAEEFYLQPTGEAMSYFDGDTDGATWEPSEPLGSMLMWNIGDEGGMVVGGTECVFPAIRLDPILSAPITVTFRDANREFSVTSFAAVVIAPASIDLKNKIALDFVDPLPLTWTGDVGPLGPGPVDVLVEVNGGTGIVEVCWEDAVIGG